MNGAISLFVRTKIHVMRCEFKSCSWWGVHNTTLCDEGCQWL